MIDWNRLEKHEIVGYASVPDQELRLLVEEETGHEREIAVPIVKGGVAVCGHDHKPSLLHLKLKLIRPMPRPSPATAPKHVRVHGPAAR